MLSKCSRSVASPFMHKLLSNSPKSLSSSSSSPSDPIKKEGTTIASTGIKERAFLDHKRQSDEYRDALQRINDYDEIMKDPNEFMEQRQTQAARCMDCGTPFCQSYTGCPLNNLIPEWNDLVYKNDWKQAIERLHKTNNFPEFTGRVCPAPCEGACVVGLVDDPVTIKNIEYSIVDKAFENGWIEARAVQNRSGLNVAVIGSGPAGLAAADILNQCGHYVHVYEREDSIGGLLMYGIPSMKLSKDTLKRRIDLLEKEGIVFHTNQALDDGAMIQLKESYEAMVLCVGSTKPRDLPQNIRGRNLKGIHFAMEFLTKNQKHLMINKESGILMNKFDTFISAKDKNVIVIGGGDTGCDCIGTAMRHSAKSIINLELMAKPPNTRDGELNPWPQYPKVYSLDYGHAEVAQKFGYDPRKYNIATKEFIADENGNVKGLKTVQIDNKFNEIADSERIYDADLVLLAMGFTNPEQEIISALDINTTKNFRNDTFTIDANNTDYKTNIEGIFAAGDCRRGQSLVVWAIAEGRGAAKGVHEYFKSMGYLHS